MRRTSFAAFVLALALVSPAAQAGSAIIAGSYNCSQHVPCDDKDNNFSSTQWAAAGSQCVTQGFGYHSPSGFFNDVLGLDSSNCLTIKDNIPAKDMDPQVMPQCCVIHALGNSCVFHCDMVRR